MKLTILGKYGPYPAAGGACSGYLIEQGGNHVLIDCGSGVLSRLQQVCKIHDLSAIVLSHLHSDHMADMLVLRYALEIGKARGILSMGPIPVYLPENPPEIYQQIISSPEFRPVVLKDGLQAEIGGLKFTFREMTHPVQSFAMAVEYEGKKLVYTGDTNMNDKITEFVKGASFLVADAGLLQRDKTDQSPHLTAEEVGIIASEAGVKNLILSHIWPGYVEEQVINEAARYFRNPILAEEMKVIEI